MARQGSLSCVGVGMVLGAHLAPRARSLIEQADVVFCVVSDPLVEQWLAGMNADVRSLQDCYAPGRPRLDTYREMQERVLAQVRAGRRVCLALYGHPGVFARMPHEAVAAARAEGHPAHMEPAISAEDCLYADLGIDPGRVGCQHHEATQLLLNQRRLDPSAWLVVWQVALAGDRRNLTRGTTPAHRALLVERLQRDYPRDHEVVVYEAATLAIAAPRIERLPLSALPEARLELQSTLVVPPAMPLRADPVMHARLAALEAGACAMHTVTAPL
ncbi:MAG: SAM-dependent methyltransferase [Pseudoxanthomonas sp.]|nr:SAM-dependent methyltransferase [Pseudoxanthomonas sp.]